MRQRSFFRLLVAVFGLLTLTVTVSAQGGGASQSAETQKLTVPGEAGISSNPQQSEGGDLQGTESSEASSSAPAQAPETQHLARAIALAREARDRAYVPYSRFSMGAAVGTEKGVLVPGALVENVSLGLSMCAERSALFSTVAQEAGRPNLLVLVSPRTDGNLTFPCGACLQVALELGGPDLHVEACDLQGVCQGARVHELAPRLPYKNPK